jgi:formylglycine-generating enzyme required for sulfatase activity
VYLKDIGTIVLVSVLSLFISLVSQEAVTEDKGVDRRTFTNSIGMKFVLIPAGSFMMGSPPDESSRGDDERQHRVTLTKGFYMGVTEVTQRQWRQIMGNNPSHFQDCGAECPVEFVSWNDCQEFVQRLNQSEVGNGYRLPTEAEWEYACRAGSITGFANGSITQTGCGHDANLDVMGWYCGNSGKKPHPVAQRKPNAFGLYDMHGSIWEWCQDWYGIYPSGHVSNPTGPSSGSYRVLRGGGWHEDVEGCRSATRVGRSPGSMAGTIGFRLARTPNAYH